MAVIQQTNFPNLYHRGKIRDTYDLGGGLLLMVPTDRISAFDVVLPTAIPDKGLVLSQLSAFWFGKTAHLIPNHLVKLAHEEFRLKSIVESSLLDSLSPEIAKRAMVVRKACRIDVECVVRGYLAGSAWDEYQERGTIQGKAMSKGLREGERLSPPLFTPTTKAETGHDQPLSWQELEEMVGPSLARQLEVFYVVIRERHWTLFTNHAAIFIHLLENPEATIRSTADELGLAERTVVGVLQDLRREGYLLVRREGRNNVYQMNPGGLMKRPEHEGYTFQEFLAHVQSALEQVAFPSAEEAAR